MSSTDRRSYLKTIGAVTLAGGIAGCTNQSQDGSDGADDQLTAVVPGTAPGFKPFEQIEDGELVGFDIDLLEAVAEEGGIELAEWSDFEFDSLIPALEDGSIDVIAAAMTITEDRQERVAFSDPYYSADQSVLVGADADFQPDTFADLEGRAVGAQSGTTGESIVQSELIDAGVITEDDYSSYENYVLAVQDLERGILDAIVIDQPVAQSFQANRDVDIAFVYETDEQYGFAVQQDADELRSALNDGLTAVRDSGEYQEITSRWFDE